MPSTMPNGVRRYVPSGHSLKVPLLHDNPLGEWLEGQIVVPSRLAHAKPDTNEKHEFDRVIRENLQRWAEWRERRGWTMTTVPKVTGPVKNPTPRTGMESDEDTVLYFALARFKRSTPLFVGLEDFLAINDRANTYNIAPEADPLPWNVIKTKRDTGWIDPLKEAEEERQRLGLRKEDYLMEYPEDSL